MSDVLMRAVVASIPELPAVSYDTRFMPMDEFREREDWYRPYHDSLWKLFNTRGKHAAIEGQAQWIVVALDQGGKYLGSALIVETPPIWYVHYVMAVPEMHRNGIGRAIMTRIMEEVPGRTVKISWVLLNCDPGLKLPEDERLPAFYGKFGFRVIAE